MKESVVDRGGIKLKKTFEDSKADVIFGDENIKKEMTSSYILAVFLEKRDKIYRETMNIIRESLLACQVIIEGENYINRAVEEVEAC